jgi:hypothetical protein
MATAVAAMSSAPHLTSSGGLLAMLEEEEKEIKARARAPRERERRMHSRGGKVGGGNPHERASVDSAQGSRPPLGARLTAA